VAEKHGHDIGTVERAHSHADVLLVVSSLDGKASGIRAGRLEDANGAGTRFDIAHRGYVLSSVLASASFLEAVINEMYQDAHDGHGVSGDGYIAPLQEKTRHMMAQLWRAADEGRMRASASSNSLHRVTPRGAFPLRASTTQERRHYAHSNEQVAS
jgi:hypothetical protein